MRIACWNTEWNKPQGWKGQEMRRQLLEDDPEIICCPEAYVSFIGDGWHGVFSQSDYGYPMIDGRRKVALWSRQPWENVDDVGATELPPGRFVSGETVTSLGRLRVIAVCVPWSAAHVSTGSRDRKRWEDHLAYLRGLRSILRDTGDDVPTVLLGDLNQCVPRRTAPIHVYEELAAAIEGYEVWTTGRVAGLASFPVCHIAGSAQLRCDAVSGYDRHLEQGRTLSDHDGLRVDLGLR